MRIIIVFLLSLYQKMNVFGSRCRYFPSCSNYAIEAVDKHGSIKGLWLTIRRLLKCNQFFPGGFDPVP